MKVNIFKKAMNLLRDKAEPSFEQKSNEPNSSSVEFDIQAAAIESRRRFDLLSQCKDMLDIVNIEGIDHLQYFSSESGSIGVASIDGQTPEISSLWTERAQSIIALIKEGISIETGKPPPQQSTTTVTAFEMNRSGNFVLTQRVDKLYNESKVTIKGQLGNSQDFSHEFEFDYSLAPISAAEVRRIGRANYDHVCMGEAQRSNLKSRMTM
ncbi:hypothetical protein CL689_06820 [Candidatus Saccharibacteria bacterium]|nr:hypothetical protein [Candidatus Saccharibacteria bacterium]|tara:strand:+ start:2182 stop:2811 length:630 start_codon:yes stop_codon:yes gene_type:complete